jgi:hypothetical protein
MENKILIQNNNDEIKKLTEPKIMNLFLSSLKSVYKQQENKKKNYKKLMNLFSVRVQKYDDSSSHTKTDEKLKAKKSDLANKMYKRRKTAAKGGNEYYANEDARPIKNKKFNYDDTYVNNYSNKSMKYNPKYENHEYNSDSSIYTKDKILYEDSDEEEEGEYSKLGSNKYKNKKTFSINKNLLNERSKFFKHKFNKEHAKSKKFLKDGEGITIKSININMDSSIYNSYKSNNSTENNLYETKNVLNYYLIKSIEEDKDLLFYNEERNDNFKYDNNYKCYYSLDHKSRIIYIKPSPKLMSSINSILNTKIVSRKTTKSISNEQSGNFTQTPKKKEKIYNGEKIMLKFNQESIIEKLKDIELLRNDEEIENIITKNLSEYECSSENEEENLY